MSGGADLERLLADLRTDLRRGRYERLREVLPILETRLAGSLPDDAAAMARLRTEARHTADAAQAALRGLRAGQQRITELMRIEAGFLSYDAGGTPASSSPPVLLSRQL